MANAKKKTVSERIAAALDLFYAAGFVDGGETSSRAVRVGTSRSPIYGRTGGELRTFGGRQRLVLPETNLRATVGAQTTNIYRVVSGECDFIANLTTDDHDGISKAIAKIVQGAA